MSFVLDSLYMPPGKNIPKGKPKSLLNVVCNIQGHIRTDLLLCASCVATSEMCINHVSLFKYNVPILGILRISGACT